jgi:uncharacterized protein
MIGLLTDEEIDTMLARHRVGRLACSANDRPYVAPINYRYDGQCVVAYSMVGRKITVLREQPLACFEIDEITPGTGWRSVVAEGVYEELTDEKSRREALNLLNLCENGIVGRSLNADGPLVLFRIRLHEKSGRFERRDA